MPEEEQDYLWLSVVQAFRPGLGVAGVGRRSGAGQDWAGELLGDISAGASSGEKTRAGKGLPKRQLRSFGKVNPHVNPVVESQWSPNRALLQMQA